MQSEEQNHPGHPQPNWVPNLQPTDFEFDPRSAGSYEKSSIDPLVDGMSSVLEVSKKLYRACPPRLVTQLHDGRTLMEYCVGMICRVLLCSSQEVSMSLPPRFGIHTLIRRQISSVLPVRIECDYKADSIQNFAALITTLTDQQILLPISTRLIGSSNRRNNKPNSQSYAWKVSTALQRPTNTLETILDVFKSSPILICKDVWFLDGRVMSEKGPWKPRKFADVWYLGKSLATASICFKLRDNHGNERYSDPSVLTQRILELGLTPSWHHGSPTTPFSRCSLSVFDLQQQAPLSSDGSFPLSSTSGSELIAINLLDSSDNEGDGPIPSVKRSRVRDKIMLVNGLPSCQLFLDCHEPMIDESRYCEFHSATLLRGALQFDGSLRSFGGHTQIPIRMNVKVELKSSRLRDLPRWKNALRRLRSQYRSHAKETWVIDTEFIMVHRAHTAVPLSISIRDIHGADLLSSRVNYNDISLNSFLDLVFPHLSSTGEARPGLLRMAKSIFVKQYGGGKTHGLSASQIGNRILDLGYSRETHRILSWSSATDLQIFHRFLDRGDSVMVDYVEAATDINLMWLCRYMLPPEQYVGRLGIVHSMLCPDSTITEYHYAENDTMATCEVIKAMVEAED